ncbi:MAG: hypothetical protein MMC23_009181 [Stictis urceolatum]|nr:hypothetical protein [Stictis urceolata]
MSTPSAKSSAAAARGAKSKQSKQITLKLPSSQLSKFPHEKPITKSEPSKASSPSSSPATPTAANKDSPPSSESKTDVKTETPNGTSSNLQVPVDGRKKGTGGSKAGTKRPLSAIADGQPKPRGKPGPKKRKLDGTPNGEEVSRPWTTPAPAAGHKLGPKANQGAINAGLRALDRTGKPCRKWEKKGFALKSFTGVVWTLPSWGAPKRQSEIKGEPGQSDTPTSNSENHQPQSSSNVGSETSRNIADIPDGVADSPAVVTASA